MSATHEVTFYKSNGDVHKRVKVRVPLDQMMYGDSAIIRRAVKEGSVQYKDFFNATVKRL